MKLSFPGLLIGIVLTWLVANLLTPAHYNPYLVLTISDETRVHILHQQLADEPACRKLNQTLGSALLFGCPACSIEQNACLDTLDDTQSLWLENPSINLPSINFDNGIIVFQSDDIKIAETACKLTESQTASLPPEERLRCLPAESNRPKALTSDDTQGIGAIRIVLLSSIVVFAGLIVLLLSHRNKTSPPLWLEKIALITTDGLVLSAAFIAVNIHGNIDTRGLTTQLILTLVTLGWFWVINEHYARRRPFWDELREIFRALSIILLLASTAILQTDCKLTPTLVLWLSTFALIPLGRASLRAFMHSLGIWERPAIIVGTGNNARDAYLAIRQEKNLGYRVTAFAALSDQVEIPEKLQICKTDFPVIRLEEDLAGQLNKLGKPQIIIGLDSLAPLENQRLIKTLSRLQHNIHIIPTLRGLPLFGTQLSHFFSHEVLFMTVRNNLARRSYRWIKRSFDIFVSLCLIALLSPVLIALTLLIRRSGGTAFYGHQRIGQDGKLFKCLKFRSMRPDADKVLKELLANDPVAKAEWDKDFKLKNDPRITPVGHFIRKTSLDELPQLFNVLKGEMSLVGPRPVVKDELERYGSASVFYLEAKPGITGLWQISGRNDTTYAERVSLDSWYVQNWSLWYDIAILFKTFDVVFNRRGAY